MLASRAGNDSRGLIYGNRGFPEKRLHKASNASTKFLAISLVTTYYLAEVIPGAQAIDIEPIPSKDP